MDMNVRARQKLPSHPVLQKYGAGEVRSGFSGEGIDSLRDAFIGSFKMMVIDLNPTQLLPWCIRDEIISPQEADEVSAKETRQDKNYHLLCTIHRKSNADVRVLDRFRIVLETINTEPGSSGCLQHIIDGLNSQRLSLSESGCVTEDSGHWQALLETMYATICASVDAKHILPHLISKEVITVTQSEEVYNETTSERRNASLLSMVHYSSGAKIRGLFEVLQDLNQIPQTLTVAELVKLPAKKATRKLATHIYLQC